jgi:hypothetical protein
MPTVEARIRSGTSAPDQAAAAAAVSIRELIAPPWTTSPIVGGESLNGIESRARSGVRSSTTMPRWADERRAREPAPGELGALGRLLGGGHRPGR